VTNDHGLSSCPVGGAPSCPAAMPWKTVIGQPHPFQTIGSGVFNVRPITIPIRLARLHPDGLYQMGMQTNGRRSPRRWPSKNATWGDQETEDFRGADTRTKGTAARVPPHCTVDATDWRHCAHGFRRVAVYGRDSRFGRSDYFAVALSLHDINAANYLNVGTLVVRVHMTVSWISARGLRFLLQGVCDSWRGFCR